MFKSIKNAIKFFWKEFEKFASAGLPDEFEMRKFKAKKDGYQKYRS